MAFYSTIHGVTRKWICRRKFDDWSEDFHKKISLSNMSSQVNGRTMINIGHTIPQVQKNNTLLWPITTRNDYFPTNLWPADLLEPSCGPLAVQTEKPLPKKRPPSLTLLVHRPLVDSFKYRSFRNNSSFTVAWLPHESQSSEKALPREWKAPQIVIPRLPHSFSGVFTRL